MEDDQIIKEFKSSINEAKLYVDAREPPHIFKLLDNEKAEYIKTLLPVGDFVFGDICIERKEIGDFINSMRSGHLYKQLINMQNNFKRNFLIISGKRENVFANPFVYNWTLEHHLGSLARILVSFNSKIVEVDNDKQLVNFIFKILKKANDGKTPTIFDTELMLIKATDADIKTKMFMCLPLVSKHKAQKLSEQFEVKIVRKADGELITYDNFPWIEGIGEKTIKNIVKLNSKIPFKSQN